MTTQAYEFSISTDFSLPQYYIPLLLLLEFQQFVCFCVKVLIFWPIFFVHRIKLNQKRKVWESEIKTKLKDDLDAQKLELETNLLQHWQPILNDLEIDQENRKIMYKSKYACNLLYVLAVRLYPVEQWFLIMWKDCNPYIEYRHCNFCNEMFTPGEHVHCS